MRRLGFLYSNDLMTYEPGGRQGPGYIVLRVQHEPLDQTDLSNGLDVSSKVVGNGHKKMADRRAQGRPGGTTYRPGGPTY